MIKIDYVKVSVLIHPNHQKLIDKLIEQGDVRNRTDFLTDAIKESLLRYREKGKC